MSKVLSCSLQQYLTTPTISMLTDGLAIHNILWQTKHSNAEQSNYFSTSKLSPPYFPDSI